MRILFLVHSFNSLAQRLYVELAERGHELSVEFDVNDGATREAVALFRPDLVLAAFLKRAIPEDVWRACRCLVVHPGIPGDGGPSALDWAILEREPAWGVTVLQAEAEMDAGPVWAYALFPMRPATKSSLYRREVADAAVRAVLEALDRIAAGGTPVQVSRAGTGQTPVHGGQPLARDAAAAAASGAAATVSSRAGDPAGTPRGRARPPCRSADRLIDWQRDSTDLVLRKIRSADGTPGVVDAMFDRPVRLFDAHRADGLAGQPGSVIARCGGALARATRDGAVWIGHVRELREQALKLPAASVFAGEAGAVPIAADHGYRPIRYEEHGAVGRLHFDFYNGAMSTAQCRELRDAFTAARARPTRVLLLMGGRDYWSNGIHLGLIEAAESPADESWLNINAMDDLARDIITTTDRLVVAALRANAGAGGVFLALAADEVWAREGIVLNPHYKDMGNLYGSEYWTYLLPRRAGAESARRLTQARLPMGVQEASRLGLVDRILPAAGCEKAVIALLAQQLADDAATAKRIAEKRRRRAVDEAAKPLEAYRAEELARMRLNFYGFDPSYHVARFNFIHHVPKSRTPLTLARHRSHGAAAKP